MTSLMYSVSCPEQVRSRRQQRAEEKPPINRKNPADPGSGRAASFCPCLVWEGERTEQRRQQTQKQGILARGKGEDKIKKKKHMLMQTVNDSNRLMA